MDHHPGTSTIRMTLPRAIVIASGDFDITTTPALSAQMDAAVADGCDDLRLDLEAVSFCDASMMGMLAGLDGRLRAADGSLRIVAASTPVRRVLHLVDLRRLLDPELQVA
jgi:anti-sigma B factor antagonist